MAGVLLSLREVSKSYWRGPSEVRVLAGASLDVHQGELVAVWGKRGAGKTTLLRIAAGLERPDGGVVRFEGEDLATLSDGAVLLNLQTKRYFSLNETGTRIWELVQQTAEEETIVATMLREYEVDEAMARTEVRRILDELIDAQLIVPV